MALLQIVYAPHPIFRQKSEPVKEFDALTKQLIADLSETLYHEQAIGLCAPMVGISKQIAVVDIQEGGSRTLLCLINPEILSRSQETQTHEEASLSFPYIGAEVTRPLSILVRYMDEHGATQERSFQGFLATVIQHEMDYFEGRNFLDHLSRIKRERLLSKMHKLLKKHPPHVHGEHCDH